MNAPYHHIVCCVDESEPASQALARARVLGAEKLTLLHVLSLPIVYSFPVFGYVPEPPELRGHVEQWLQGLVQPGEDWFVADGHPPSVACEYAETHHADLMVAAAHRGFVDRVILGSFAGYLSHNAPCDVLLVRPR